MASTTVKDGVGANVQFGVEPDAEGFLTPRQTPLVNGEAIADDNPMPVASPALGGVSDPEVASGNGSAISLLKRIRTLLGGTLTTSNATIGATTDAEATSGDGSVVALLKNLRTRLGGTLNVGGVAAAGAAPTAAPVSVSGVDGGGLKRHFLTDTDGTQRMRRKGSTGTGASVNLPNVSTLGTLLATVAVNSNRSLVFVENQSASTITVVGDDGADANIWHRILTGVGANQQGADWSSDCFFGRIRVYGASGARVSIAEY